ncbi:MAG: alpha/beta hydrolase-fold protein [Planctomycetota bacterium]
MLVSKPLPALRRAALLLAALAFPALALPALAQELPTTPVTFEIAHDAPPGRAVFVVGDTFALGSGDPRRGVKLVEDAGDRWWLTIELPGSAQITYRLLERDQSDGALLDLTNATEILGETTITTPPAEATPALPGHALLVRTELVNPLLFWRQGEGAFVPVTMDPIDESDAGPLREYAAWNVGDASRQLEFYLLSTVPFVREPASESAFTSYPATAYTNGHAHAYIPPAAWSPQRIETGAVPTGNVLDTRTVGGVTGRGVRVLLPRNYDSRPAADYPVLYMHDGQNVFDPGGPFGSWSLEDSYETQTRLGRTDEAIVVAIDNSQQRNAELAREFSTGGSVYAGYERFVLQDLMPWVEANYRVRTGVAHTGIAGSSLGGLASATLPMDNPGVFGKAGLFSPSFWLGGTKARVDAGGLDGVRTYLDAGTQSDGLQNTFTTRDALLTRGAPMGITLGEGLQHAVGLNQAHNEAAWRARTPGFLRFMHPAREADTSAVALAVLCARLDTNNDRLLDFFDLLDYLGDFDAGASDADIDGSGTLDFFDVLGALDAFSGGC